MKILLYTQQGVLGGSLRLLFNLARHLALRHEVSVAFPRGYSGELLLPSYKGIAVVDWEDAALPTTRYDVAVCHAHRSIEPVAAIDAARKLAVSMEIATLFSPTVTNDHLAEFDGFLHLHEEQAAHFSETQRRTKCHLLPLINNIEHPPPYTRSGAIGCVGACTKHDANTILKVLARARRRPVRVWSESSLNLQGLGWWHRRLGRHYQRSGRLQEMGLNTDVTALMSGFDLLLHTPHHGNGTSTVISDALASGKNVLLSPVPAYRKAYSALPGVHFFDQRRLRIEEIMGAYDRVRFERIRDAYSEVYDRKHALAQWQRAIEG